MLSTMERTPTEGQRVGTERESLYERLDRLAGLRKWAVPIGGAFVVVVVLRVLFAGARFGLGGRGGAAGMLFALSAVLAPLAVVTAVWLVGTRLRVSAKPERQWTLERRLASLEVAESEARDLSSVGEGAARLFMGDVPALDSALEMLQVASGEKVYPRFERLPESVYGRRVDACVRLEAGIPVLCFTPAMLQTFDADELFAVIAHLIARAQVMRYPSSRTCDGVREADARALLLTRDHVALLRALEASRTGAVPVATPGDREAWFSEDEAIPDERDDGGQVVSWRRIDRLEELRDHLGPLGLDVPIAPPEIRLARLFDVESGMLTEAAKEGLRR
jgi:hypothetical protein